MVLILGGCWQSNRGPLTGHHTKAPPNFAFIGYTSPCYLELPTVPRSFAVNCFQINGVLHIHSNRFAKWPRLIGESWVDTVRRAPEVRVELNGLIYAMIATPVENEQRRQAILKRRGYWHAWQGITIFSFTPSQKMLQTANGSET